MQLFVGVTAIQSLSLEGGMDFHVVEPMTYEKSQAVLGAAPSIDAVIAAHGARKVLAAAVASLLRGKTQKCRPPDSVTRVRLTGHLSDHLLRDIGVEQDRAGHYRHLR